MKRLNKLQSIAASVLILSSTLAGAAEIAWYASSGLTPDKMGFTLQNSSYPEIPLLQNSILTLSNNSSSEQMRYGMFDPSDLNYPAVFEATFNMRYVSGVSWVYDRAPAGVNVSLGAYSGITLWIGNDDLFLSSNSGRGATVAIDTNDDFHDYLLRINGTEVTVFQDGAPVLSGSTFTNSDSNAADKRISFGELSTLAYGASEWKSFSHNAAIPEPASAGLIALFAGGIIFVRRFFAD